MLPQYSHRPNLPYVSAVFKEIVWWRLLRRPGLSWLPTLQNLRSHCFM